MGSQNTLTLSDFQETEKYKDYIWMTKLSIRSFQKWFLDAECVLLYNGHDFSRFCDMWFEIEPQCEAKLVNQYQKTKDREYANPYPFFPIGVWWKWVPFRLDISKHEIAVDTDIICISRPDSWIEWLKGDAPVLVAPERFEHIKVNTCGDLWNHPLLKNKRPANCGVVGQLAGNNFEKRFFEITEQVRYGRTHDSMFITEQGVVNLWIYSLSTENIKHTILDFKRNAWIRDFLFFMRNGVKVETIHAVSWHKQILRKLKDVFEERIFNDSSDEDFVTAVLREASKFGGLANNAILQQLQPDFGPDECYLVQI